MRSFWSALHHRQGRIDLRRRNVVLNGFSDLAPARVTLNVLVTVCVRRLALEWIAALNDAKEYNGNRDHQEDVNQASEREGSADADQP